MNPDDWKTASNATLLDLVMGAVMPLIVSVVMRPTWANWFRALATAAVCILASLLKCYCLGFLSAADILRSILLTMLMCFSFYRSFWKPLGTTGAIESATSPTNQTNPTTQPTDQTTDKTKEETNG